MNSKIHNLLYKSSSKAIYDNKQVNIHKTTKISSRVVIGKGFVAGAGVKILGPVSIGKDCRINDNSIIEDTIIWDGVTVGENTRLKRCIISSGAMIPDNQIIENSIITPGQILPLPDVEDIKR